MKKLLPYICCLMVLSSTIESQEIPISLTNEQILTTEPAGTYAIQENDLATVNEKREKITDESDEEVKAMPFYQTTHQRAFHTAYKFIDYFSKIELDDGSIWYVSSSDQWKIRSWYSTDLILLLPNHGIFKSFEYQLVNQRTGDYVEVNLAEMEVLSYDPSFFGLRRWITSIDYYSNTLTLNDGSFWSISFSDDTIFSYFNVGDVVFIGMNDNWDQSSNPNILVHFRTAQYVRGSAI
ncbi:hypothetical protein BN1013_01755 [Candidatus Rubidus massiliensis]|nr:hypothetical protein BN1013_01755 [Candidatus Rubidus massiliensis]